MAQTIISTPQLLLSATDQHSETFPDDWEGDFQFLMTVAGRENVRLEVLRPGTTTWMDVRFEGRAQNFARAGDTFNLRLARGFSYRLETAAAGAEVYVCSL